MYKREERKYFNVRVLSIHTHTQRDSTQTLHIIVDSCWERYLTPHHHRRFSSCSCCSVQIKILKDKYFKIIIIKE